MKELKSCPVCGRDELVTLSTTQKFKIGIFSIYIPNYNYLHCNSCDEEFLIEAEYNKLGKIYNKLNDVYDKEY